MADLTTLAKVREFTQKPAGVTTDQDPLVSSLITRASVMLQNALGRELAPTNGTTRTFAYLGAGMVDTGDLRHVTAVSYDSDATSPTALTSGQWFLRPQNATNGIYQRLWLPDYATAVSSRYRRDISVSITGDWGFAAVPADVEHGCIVTVTTWLREASAIVVDSGVVGFERRGKIPQDVLDGLQHYVMPVI